MTAQPIKLPVIITVTGDQAKVGMNRLGVQLKALETNIGKYFQTQVGSITGMMAGFLTVEALIAGVQKVLAHGQAVIDRVSQFSGEAVTAQTRLDAAQLRQDVQMGSVLGPEIAAKAQEQQAMLGLTGQADVAAAQLKLEADSFWNYAKAQVMRAFTGDFDEFNKAAAAKRQEIGQFYLGDFADIFVEDPLMEAQRSLEMAQALAPLPSPVTAGGPANAQDAQNAAVIRELQQQVAELRQMNRTIGAN